MSPRASAHVHGDHPGGESGRNVVVDAIADVRDLVGVDATLEDDPLEERRRGFLDTPAGRRADQVDVVAQEVLGIRERVADGTDAQLPAA